MHKVYLRDWYFNAGIVGFLRVVSDDAQTADDLKKSPAVKDGHLVIGDNYIEFDSEVLDGFEEKFIRMAFEHLFEHQLHSYKRRIASCLNEINGEEEKAENNLEFKRTNVTNLKTKHSLSGKVMLAFFEELNNGIDKIKDLVEFKKKLDKTYDLIQNLSSKQFYKSYHSGSFIGYFLSVYLEKRLVSYQSFLKYIHSIRNIDTQKEIKNNDKCLSCQTRSAKGGYELSNSISNVIAFNSDNSNWIWGHEANNMKLCGVCALIYSCAVLAFVPFSKGQEQSWYSINNNSNINELFGATLLFINLFAREPAQNQPFSQTIRQTVIELTQKQAQSVIRNINFIEMKEGGIGGQSSKSYHVFNYIISEELARFINSVAEEDLPKGRYSNVKGDTDSKDITEELIQNTILQQIGYQDLWRYMNHFIRGTTQFNSYVVFLMRKYIFGYINHFRGGKNMEDAKKISKKAFYNGKELREAIISSTNNDNKITGIAYQILNVLKIEDREKFLDIYMRLMMSYKMDISFGSNDEMIDTDGFLQFGYSFLNGLLAKEKAHSDKKAEAKNG